jgi:capsular exopolysaccharide synthesis family protein
MSDIFDALQRSEAERGGDFSPVAVEARDLLLRAEQRAASEWRAAALSDSRNGVEGGGAFAQGPSPAAVQALEAFENGKYLSTEGSQEPFAKFPSLELSPAPEARLVCLTDGESLAAEGFRLLGVRLRHLRQERPIRKVLVTSTCPQEGKSTVAANLACSLALKTRSRTLLLDGDLRRSSLSLLFGLEGRPGISECLDGQETVENCIHYVQRAGIWILPSGVPSRALELMQSAKLSALMEQLKTWFDWVIVDSPPVLPLADTSVWARLADGILLVTRRGITERWQLKRGLEALDSKKLIGAVLNDSSSPARGDYYYYRRSAYPEPNGETTK